ncbi:MAG: hypothetical protein JWR21_2606 [Herminiimonas sp.]|nr:hypothetical protein [Herminiimonas sp.]
MTASANTSESVLVFAFQDLEDAREDFRQAEFKDAARVLGRFLLPLDREPLAGFLASLLPPVDLDAWLKRASESAGSFAGSAELDWPHDRAERVALQLAVSRALASKKLDFLNFVHHHFHVGTSLSAHVFVFNQKILVPFIRDLRRLTELRRVTSVLMQAMGKLPTSGDAILDNLLQDASNRFRDPAPAARRDAVEKLWDGWERLKTLDAAGNKSASVQVLLNTAAEPGSTFRTLLETEARALTDIGNSFHIRHFETNKAPVPSPEHVDYLFHRLYALVNLLITARAGQLLDKR